MDFTSIHSVINREPSPDMTFKEVTKRPIFGTISAALIVITLLFLFGTLKTVPCGDGVMKAFNRSFVHLDFIHLFTNIFVFFVLSRIEVKFGSGFFMLLILQLLVITTVMELILKKFWNVPCSIGFSGVLFGLAVWELVYDRNVNMALILGILAMVVTPTIQNPKASLVGHGLGALAGLMVAIYYKPPK